MEEQTDNLRLYADLAREALAAKKADLILLPETSVRGDEEGNVAALAQDFAIPILSGVMRDYPDHWTNTAVLLDANGQHRAEYDKTKPVPFGEFCPQRGLIGKLYESFGGHRTDCRAGEKTPLFGATPDLTLGVIICYESAFPHLTRRYVQDGADAIALLTSDQTFGNTAGPYQHFDLAIVRAVETGRPVLRVARTGMSAIIQPTGAVIEKRALGVRSVVLHDLPLTKRATLYVRLGEWFLFLCCGVILTAGVLAARAFRTAGTPPSTP
jgi:apolipoprotein N-acyltransferase